MNSNKIPVKNYNKIMKRKADDIGDEDGYHNRKRRRPSEPQNREFGDRLEWLLLQVGGKSTASLESDLQSLVSILEVDLETFRTKILCIIAESAVELPFKCVDATLVGLLNASNCRFGEEVVDHIVKTLVGSLKNCKWHAARYYLRFLANLVNCHVVSGSSLLQLLARLIDVTDEDKAPQVCRDWYVFAVLSTLIWVGRELYGKEDLLIDRLLVRIEKFLNKRKKMHQNALSVWSMEGAHPQEEYLDCLFQQIRKLRRDEWIETYIPRSYRAFDSILREAMIHKLPEVIPPMHEDNYSYPIPSVVYRMFDYTDCPDGLFLPSAHSIERFLIEEHIHFIIETFHTDRKNCATQLLNAPYKSKIPLEYCIVEVIFAEMFQMPRSRYLEICYGSILLELCFKQPETLPPILVQATGILFMRIDSMNASCFDRFVSWFSYHLSNLRFIWPWSDWNCCLSLDLEHPKRKFVQEVLQKCSRLSYYERVVGMVPERFSILCPARPQPFYKYADEGTTALEGRAEAHQLVVAIKQKCSCEEVIEILTDLPGRKVNTAADNFEICSNTLKIDVFVQTLLSLGSKTISHTFAAISKFYPVFKALAESKEEQICVLQSVFDLWRNKEQMVVIVVGELLKLQIVKCLSVAAWIFSEQMNSEFTKMYLWEILHSTIGKITKYVLKLNIDLAEAKNNLARVNSPNSVEESTSERNKIPGISETPSEEMVERMEETLEYLSSCRADNRDYDTHWYRWTISRLQQVFLMHHEQVVSYCETLEALLFTSDLDSNILNVYKQFVSLYS